MSEVFTNLEKKKHLPAYKIPSHYVNGLLTVAFGGSTGIEVSTVVSTAALGSVASSKSVFLRKYKNVFTCAGIAAGITALFNAPLAGVLFALEVFQQKLDWKYFLSLVISVTISFGVNWSLWAHPVFDFNITDWHLHALPYLLLLGVLAALLSVYLTKTVLFIKEKFSALPKESMRVLIGALFISLAIFVFPALYGEGYFAVEALISGKGSSFLMPLLGILLLKPIATAVTLGAGGDGGVFAPGLFLGAFLGYIVAFVLNHYFHADVITVNFMVIGMAAMLSGSIHAPFTAIFLVCAMVGNYQLLFPAFMVSVLTWYTSRKMLPYSVYSYGRAVRS